MSSKSKKEKKEDLEPMPIETTILKINIKTTGDLITKDYDLIPFHPNMSDLRDLSNNNYILFPSFVKITMKDLQKAGAGQDYPKIFMNLEKYIKLIKYVTNPEKEDDPTLFIDKSQAKNYAMSLAQNAVADLMADTSTDIISIQKSEPLTDEEIVTNNIELIKNIFLPSRSHFFILGNDYVIGNSKYIPPYKSDGVNEKLQKESPKPVPLNYTVKFELELLDAANNPDAGDFGKMTCKAKKGNIAKDMKDIFGTNFGYEPEKRAPIPSILNTSNPTQRRNFTKLQREWEERNKYTKAPQNERERKKMEESWSPLQKKMAEYDKITEEYNKIPPSWIKETDELDKKYEDFQKEMVKYWQEVVDIKAEKNESNDLTDTFQKDRINSVKIKMSVLLKEINSNEKIEITKEESPTLNTDEIEKILSKGTRDEVESVLIAYTTKYQDKEQELINQKYVSELTKEAGLDEKIKDLAALKERQTALLVKKDTSDSYMAASINVEIEKIQAEIRKKQTDIEFQNKKYKDIAGTWMKKRRELKTIQAKVENEKKRDEKEIANKSLKEELVKLIGKIKKEEEDLLLAGFKEGNEEISITRSEKKEFTKKDRPISKYSEIKAELANLKQTYLERSGKLGFYNKIQGEISLLSKDIERLNKIKSDKESGKKDLDRKIRDFSTELSRISSKHDEAILTTRGKIIDKEQNELQTKIIEKFDYPIKKLKDKIKLYESYINILKKIPEKTAEEDFNNKYTNFFHINDGPPQTVEERKSNYLIAEKEDKAKIKEIEKIEKNIVKIKSKKTDDSEIEEEKKKTDIASKEAELKIKRKELDDIHERVKKYLLAEAEEEMNLKINQERSMSTASAPTSVSAPTSSTKSGGNKNKRTYKHKRNYKHKRTKRPHKQRKHHTLRKWHRLKKYLRKKKRTVRRH